jgi:hypothetical protein
VGVVGGVGKLGARRHTRNTSRCEYRVVIYIIRVCNTRIYCARFDALAGLLSQCSVCV